MDTTSFKTTMAFDKFSCTNTNRRGRGNIKEYVDHVRVMGDCQRKQ